MALLHPSEYPPFPDYGPNGAASRPKTAPVKEAPKFVPRKEPAPAKIVTSPSVDALIVSAESHLVEARRQLEHAAVEKGQMVHVRMFEALFSALEAQHLLCRALRSCAWNRDGTGRDSSRSLPQGARSESEPTFFQIENEPPPQGTGGAG